MDGGRRLVVGRDGHPQLAQQLAGSGVAVANASLRTTRQDAVGTFTGAALGMPSGIVVGDRSPSPEPT